MKKILTLFLFLSVTYCAHAIISPTPGTISGVSSYSVTCRGSDYSPTQETRIWEFNLSGKKIISYTCSVDINMVGEDDQLDIYHIYDTGDAEQMMGFHDHYNGTFLSRTATNRIRIVLSTYDGARPGSNDGFTIDFQMVDYANDTISQLIVTDKLGIGTSTPCQQVQLTGAICGSGSYGNALSIGNAYKMSIGTTSAYTKFTSDGAYNLFTKPIYSQNGVFAASRNSNLYLQTNGSNSLTIHAGTGNVGIGTTISDYKLAVNGSLYLNTVDFQAWSSCYLYWAGHSLVMGSPVGAHMHNSIELKPGGCSQEPLHSQIRFYTALASNQYEQTIEINSMSNVWFNTAGNFGIGTNHPRYKLDVNGIIRANEIIVNTSGADFVFENTYRLRPLSEVADYVQEYKHLPDIQSAAEMQENGVSMNELQIQLLQKIEELTLYLIEQNEKIEQLEQQIETLTTK